MQVVKITNTEITLSATANNIYSAKCVLLVNANTTTKHVITQAYANANVISTFTIAPFESRAVVKGPTDTFKVDAGSDVGAVPITFSY